MDTNKEATLTQAQAMAFALLFGDSHQAHLQGETLGVDSWYVRDHEDNHEHDMYTFEECLTALADQYDLECRPYGEET